LALPEGVKSGQKTPWLWYFPSDYKLPGTLEQWMINKCLANGIAVAGIDVAGDFGTPAGRATFSAFYEELSENHGLTKKACLLARSYGGLQMYNWAAEHPESVACLAGIYPVCNMASYPGLKSAAGKYRMSHEQLVKELKAHNPVDRLAPLAVRHLTFASIVGEHIMGFEVGFGKADDAARLIRFVSDNWQPIHLASASGLLHPETRPLTRWGLAPG
jgi:pimeloyl-ACP methyl ester carboxylesterase